MEKTIKKHMKFLETSANSRSAFWACIPALVVTCCTSYGRNPAFEFMEKYREFPPAVAPLELEPGKPGLVVSVVNGRQIYLKEIFNAAKTYTPATKVDSIVLFGYLWDSELHLRCIAYLIFARDFGLPERLPPIRTLNDVGSPNFESTCLEIIKKIDSKPGTK